MYIHTNVMKGSTYAKFYGFFILTNFNRGHGKRHTYGLVIIERKSFFVFLQAQSKQKRQ